MMKLLTYRTLTLFLLFTFVNDVTAQTPSIFLLQGDSTFAKHGSFIELHGSGYYRSNALNNEYVNRMVIGGYIGPDTKANISDNLSGMNRLGSEASFGMSYWNMGDSLFNKPHLGIKLLVDVKYDASMSFTDDLYKVVFEGNEQFRGQEINFEGTAAEYYAYQKLGFGIFDKRTLSGISLSYVNGQDYLQSYVNNGSLFTSQRGDSLHVTYDGTYSQSLSNNGFGTGKGVGAAVDLNVNFPLIDDKGFISLYVNDIGFVHWNAVTTYRADSSLSYTGVEFSNLFGDELSQLEMPSLIDSLAYDSTVAADIKVLPLSLGVSMLHEIGESGFIEVGLRIKPTRSHTPEIYAKYHYFMNSTTQFSASARYGGYGNLRFGFDLQKMCGNWYVSVGSDDVPGLILNSSRGRGAYAQIGRFFGKYD
ncbi:MAG: hypothetical protein ACI84C_001290 [Flavobacteriales bacterium]|jgi:hypothetical protein